MSGPWIKRLSDQAADQLYHATNGVFRQMRIGDMALLAVHHQTTRQRPATTDFDHIAQAFRVGWLAQNAMVKPLAARFSPFEQFNGAVDGRAFLITRDEKCN